MTSPSAAHVGTSSAARTPAGTNGHHVDGEPLRTNGHAIPAVAPGRPAHAASESRTADDVEAGIIALWHTYGESRRQALRDRLVLHYAPLVKYVAGRVGTGLPAHVDVADLIQSGIFGLVDAIEKFEPERGLKFETYAMQRIRGAILDDLRSQDWVPRSVRSRARDVERALERLGGRLQRTPTDRELAAELKIGLGELRELYAQLQLTSVVALDELIAAGRNTGGAGSSLAESLPDEGAEDPIATLVDQDSRRQLADAIAQLAERDRVERQPVTAARIPFTRDLDPSHLLTGSSEDPADDEPPSPTALWWLPLPTALAPDLSSFDLQCAQVADQTALLDTSQLVITNSAFLAELPDQPASTDLFDDREQQDGWTGNTNIGPRSRCAAHPHRSGVDE